MVKAPDFGVIVFQKENFDSILSGDYAFESHVGRLYVYGDGVVLFPSFFFV